MEERVEVKFHADIDNNFVKKAIEHIGFNIKFDENRNTVFGRKSLPYSDIEKLCCMERNILEVRGITKIHYIHCDKRNQKKIEKKPLYARPIAVVIYSIIGFLAALIGIAVSGCMNTETMIIVIIISVVGYSALEFGKYHKEIYDRRRT